jgi:hypothetical protein
MIELNKRTMKIVPIEKNMTCRERLDVCDNMIYNKLMETEWGRAMIKSDLAINEIQSKIGRQLMNKLNNYPGDH